MNIPRVALVKCADYEAGQVEAAVRRAIELVGGIGAFVKPGEKILIKPNLLTDATPEQGITTHPEIVRAVIRLVKPITNHIICGDSPSVWGEKKDVDRVYETTGMRKVCQEEGVELVYFTHPVVKEGYALADWAFRCDRLINVPKFKTHGLTVLTAGLKNLFGLIVGLSKIKVHREHPKPASLSKAVVDLYEICKPDLNILDGIVAMEGDGPGSAGTLRKLGLVAASADALALDMVLSDMMNLGVKDVPTNKDAIRRGLGPKGLSEVEVLGERADAFASRDFKLPKASILSMIPSWAAALLTSVLVMRPQVVVSKCRLCGACRKICPVGAVRLDNGRVTFDRSRCILCLCCQEVCPEAAIEVRKNFVLKMLMRKPKEGRSR